METNTAYDMRERRSPQRLKYEEENPDYISEYCSGDDFIPFSKLYGHCCGAICRGEPLGFVENWLWDDIERFRPDLGMHQQDRIIASVLRLLQDRTDINPTSPDQLLVADERSQFDAVYPDASLHYRGRYWRLFVQLLGLYLAEREKCTVFDNVEGWMFNAYDEMIADVPDEQLPEVLNVGMAVPDRITQFCHPCRERRPSSKDGGRIVKGVMSYITDKCLFGRQLASRSSVKE